MINSLTRLPVVTIAHSQFAISPSPLSNPARSTGKPKLRMPGLFQEFRYISLAVATKQSTQNKTKNNSVATGVVAHSTTSYSEQSLPATEYSLAS